VVTGQFHLLQFIYGITSHARACELYFCKYLQRFVVQRYARAREGHR